MTRSFDTPFTPEQLAAYQKGVMRYEYRGVPCLRSPIDMAITMRLIGDLQPGSIIEIGSKHGGGAILLRDLTRMMDLTCKIVSIDLVAPTPDLDCEGIAFLEGNASDLEAVFAAHSLSDLPRPWLVIEDSAHTFAACTAVLQFFATRLEAGEYLVMEDGILDDLGISAQYDGGPNRAIKEFLAEKARIFEIDEFYCDMFGRNATYNPNGYLMKI